MNVRLQGWSSLRHVAVALPLLSLAPASLLGQGTRVLQLDPHDAFAGALPIDRGAAGLRQRLLELRTTASAMQTTAHPDDEQPGLLTLLSRGTGARTALLTLNRGEAGANAAGTELFDALGLLRSEELYLNDLELHGVTSFEPGLFADLVGLIETRAIRPVLARTFPLDEIRAAQAFFVAKTHVGSIVISCARPEGDADMSHPDGSAHP